MPDLNRDDLAPVSFVRGGLTLNGQVHLEGTYAYIPADQAEWDDDDQIAEYGDVFYRAGIRRGFTPASETYLAPSNRRRVKADQEASQARREELTRPGGQTALADRRTAEQIAREEASQAVGLASARPAVGEPTIPPGVDPEPSSLLTPGGGVAFPEDEEGEGDGGSDADGPTAPWEDAASLNIDETRARLARSDEDTVRAFVLWERSRVDREPRKTLLNELPEFE